MRGYPQFTFWILITLVKIYISCIIINEGKIPVASPLRQANVIKCPISLWRIHSCDNRYPMRLPLVAILDAFEENLGPGAYFSKVPETFRARKAICETANQLVWKADLLTRFQGNRKKNDFEI